MRKLLFLLPVILLLFNQRDNEILLTDNGRLANADTVRVYVDTLKSGYIDAYNAVLLDARNAGTGFAVYKTALNVGTYKGSTQYAYYRACIAVAIPAMSAKPNDVELRLYISSNKTKIDTTFAIFSAPSARAGGYTAADYTHFDGWLSSGAYTDGVKIFETFTSVGLSTSGFVKTKATAAGLDTIYAHQGDSLFIAIIQQRDELGYVWADADTSFLIFKTARTADVTSGVAAHVWYDYTPVATTDENRHGLLRGDISEGRTW